MCFLSARKAQSRFVFCQGARGQELWHSVSGYDFIIPFLENNEIIQILCLPDHLEAIPIKDCLLRGHVQAHKQQQEFWFIAIISF